MGSSSSAVLALTTRCELCTGPLVEISIPLAPEGAVTMRSCSRCDTRYWDQDGEVLNLDGVLGTMAAGGLASTRRKVSAGRVAH